MRVLVDTSVWSLALRRGKGSNGMEATELRRLVADHLVEMAGPIRQEILSGVRESSQFERLARHLEPFPDATIETEDYVTAAKFFNLCRTKRIQGSNTDFLICAVAVRHGFAIFTADKDFPRFASCLPIVLHQVPSARRATRKERLRYEEKRE